MRADMSKVITERPRQGGNPTKGERKRLQRGLEGLPFRESTARGRKQSPKMLTDVLGPLRGFLGRSVGRPWDRVYSEIRERIDPRSQVEIHILDHVRQEVETNVIMDGKLPRHPSGRWWTWSPFYVHPVTGLLQRNPVRKRCWHPLPPERPFRLEIGPDRQLHIVAGIWYEVLLAPIPPGTIFKDERGHRRIRDAFLRDGASLQDLHRRYGGPRYAVAKRQLGKKEMKRLTPAAIEAGLIEEP